MEIGLPDPADADPPDSADPFNAARRAGDPVPSRFAVVVQDDPAGAIVAVSGELDLLSAPQLRTGLDALLRTNPRHIAVDLTATTFMDSAGVHALLDAGNRADGHLAVICGGGPVRQVIELLGLTEVLNVVSSLGEYRSRRARG